MTSNIKAVFCKNSNWKTSILFKIFIYIIKISAIKVYSLVYINFKSIVNSFCIFIVSKLKYYILNLNLGFLNIITEINGKVISKKKFGIVK